MHMNGQPMGYAGPPFGQPAGYMPVAPAGDEYGPPQPSYLGPSEGQPSPGMEGSPSSSYGASPDGSYGDMSSGMVGDMHYQQFTEGAGKTSASGSPKDSLQKADPDSGVGPRRCTDLVCVLLFILYLVAMLIFLTVVKNGSVDGRAYSDVRRLTHGMDFEARLCGVDDGVEEKPFVFWCRDDPSEREFNTTPATLNLKHPVCIQECPRLSAGSQLGPNQVECLMRAQGNGPAYAIEPVPNIPGGQLGSVQNYFLMFREETVYSTTYDSELLAGRYCVPKNEALKAEVLGGPLNLGERLQKGVGSFQDCWTVMFCTVLVAVALSFVYTWVVVSLKDAGVNIVSFVLVLVHIFLLVVSIFCFMAVSSGKPIFSEEQYMDYNLFFRRSSPNQAKVESIVCGVIFLLMSFNACTFYTNVNHDTEEMHELTEAAFAALMKLRSLFWIPPLIAIAKFFTMWVVCYNFMTLCSVGIFDDYRIIVEGEPYAGMSKHFSFDPWMWLGIVIYLIGGMWVLEIWTSLGQFVISWCSVIFYFTEKEDDEKVAIPVAAWKALWIAARYHTGSIMLGAFGIWFFRIFRMAAWLWSESLPHKNSKCGSFVPLSLFNCCVQAVGSCVDGCLGDKKKRNEQAGSWQQPDSIYQQYSKDAYQDVTIQAQHFWQAKEKAQKIIGDQAQVKKYTGKCRPSTFIGVVSVAVVGFLTSYLIMNHSGINDPAKSSFIQDPVMVSAVAFFLCGSIAYDFCALYDHLADSLLYCFAYNRKANKKTIHKFVPEEIQEMIGKEVIDSVKKPSYGYHGRARPEMFVSTWLKQGQHTFGGWSLGGGEHQASKNHQEGHTQSQPALPQQQMPQGPPPFQSHPAPAGYPTHMR
eukprot:CAMPEP_0181503844 /NCGR_PEP_ID=MMETSP1110-20121109/57159_1 /TAXON_ID=174948 /ORGANISM="Symbiodinium sp., Strain CCMP421" /LENGTH=861 /DNA_ID=CAMNT_0023632625 /DNA_START=122 /DNA_END=2707 /DNA_ORIENTATION=+